MLINRLLINWDDAPSSTPSRSQRYDPEARIKFKPQQIPAPAAVVGYQGIVLHAKPGHQMTPVTQLPGATEIKHLWQKKLYVYIYIYISYTLEVKDYLKNGPLKLLIVNTY